MSEGPRILIVESRAFDDVTDNLVKGAIRELAQSGAGFKRLIVPGILEIPAGVRFAIRAMELRATDERYGGYVVLGCAIRGHTDRCDLVCAESMRALTDLTLQYTLALGNGILATDTHPQALERSDPEGGNAGGQAARTCLRMIQLKRELRL